MVLRGAQTPHCFDDTVSRTADFITVMSNVCEKKQKSFIRLLLLALLKTFVELAL